MTRGKYLSLEEARKQKRLDRFCKENPSGFPRVLGMAHCIMLCMVQTNFHCNIHLIPRRMRDIEDSYGGVRGVIPDKRDY